jgi:hypothetical protein
MIYEKQIDVRFVVLEAGKKSHTYTIMEPSNVLVIK